MRTSYLLVVSILSVIQCVAQAPGKKLVVVGLVGKWIVVGDRDTNHFIRFGTQLSADKSVKRVVTEGQNPTFGLLTVAVPEGDRYVDPVTYACDNPNSLPDHSDIGCMNAIPLITATDKTGPKSEVHGWLTQKVLALIEKDPEFYYKTVSRDAGSLDDAVLLKDGSKIDFKPSLGSLNKGNYIIAVDRLSRSAPLVEIVKSQPFSWDPDKTTNLGTPDLPMGLLQIRITTNDNETVGEVWVLVSSPQDFAKRASRYEEVEKGSSNLIPAIPAASARALRRAALDEISQ